MANGYFLFSTSMVNKSSQSAIAMASYRSGDKLYSMRDGETKNYKDRFVEPESFILKPDNAPEWTLERERLWNEVEAFEKSDNAQIARNVLVALPNNMTEEQQRELTQEYVQENFVDDGMVADVSIHRDDVNNPHAHILLTTRSFDQNGNFEKRKSKREPVLDQNGHQTYNDKGWRLTRSVKLHDWNSKKKLAEWRENFSKKLNEKSREFGLEQTYSAKSYEGQGINKTPRYRLTQNEYHFEQRKKQEAEQNNEVYKPVTYYAQKNEEIKRYNEQYEEVTRLSDYKQKQALDQQLKELRQKAHVNQDEVKATQLLSERIKGYVDYQTAKQLHEEFHDEGNKWKLKLERQHVTNKATKDLYTDIIKQHKKDPNIVEKYGFSVDNFKEEMKQEIQRIEKAENKLEEEQNKYTELQEATETGLQYQKQLLDHEFSAMYDDVSLDNYSYDEKYFATQLIKDHNIMLPEDKIKEEYQFQAKDREYNQRYTPVWKQAKDMQTSINIYDRTINKIQRTHQNNITPEKHADNMIKLKTFNELRQVYNNYLNELSPIIDNEIEKLTANKQMNQADMQVKVAALEAYDQLDEQEKENLNFKDFIKDVQKQHDQEATYLKERGQEIEDSDSQEVYSDNAARSKEIAGSLFDVVQAMSEQDRQQDSGIGKRNRAKDRSKPHRRKMSDGREM